MNTMTRGSVQEIHPALSEVGPAQLAEIEGGAPLVPGDDHCGTPWPPPRSIYHDLLQAPSRFPATF
jgi:hypothetical protein